MREKINDECFGPRLLYGKYGDGVGYPSEGPPRAKTIFIKLYYNHRIGAVGVDEAVQVTAPLKGSYPGLLTERVLE